MSSMRLIPWLLAVVLSVANTALVFAKDYTVRFNCWDKQGAGGCQKQEPGMGIHPGIDDSVFDWYQWTSLGAAKGSRIPNYSGKTIRAFHIKINGTDDTFTVPADAGGVLFPEVWRRKNGKEVLFNVAMGGAGIASGARFWSYVYPQTPGYPDPYFLGKAFEDRQPDPDMKEWERVSPETSKPSRFLTERFPEEYRDIRTYAEAANGGVLMVSDDDVLWMNKDGKELRAVRFKKTIPAGVNRITISRGDKLKGEQFVLWKDGEEVLRLPVEKLSLWPRNLLDGSASKH